MSTPLVFRNSPSWSRKSSSNFHRLLKVLAWIRFSILRYLHGSDGCGVLTAPSSVPWPWISANGITATIIGINFRRKSSCVVGLTEVVANFRGKIRWWILEVRSALQSVEEGIFHSDRKRKRYLYKRLNRLATRSVMAGNMNERPVGGSGK